MNEDAPAVGLMKSAATSQWLSVPGRVSEIGEQSECEIVHGFPGPGREDAQAAIAGYSGTDKRLGAGAVELSRHYEPMRVVALGRLVFASCDWWNEIQTRPVRKDIGVLSLQRMKGRNSGLEAKARSSGDGLDIWRPAGSTLGKDWHACLLGLQDKAHLGYTRVPHGTVLTVYVIESNQQQSLSRVDFKERPLPLRRWPIDHGPSHPETLVSPQEGESYVRGSR